jgi:hypothetical protein
MVLEKLVRLGFNKEKGKIIIADTGEEATDPVQLSEIVILKYSNCWNPISMLELREQSAPDNANSFLGIKTVPNGYIPSSGSYHPVVYFHIDDAQAKNAPKREIVKKDNLSYLDFVEEP